MHAHVVNACQAAEFLTHIDVHAYIGTLIKPYITAYFSNGNTVYIIYKHYLLKTKHITILQLYRQVSTCLKGNHLLRTAVLTLHSDTT